MAGAQYHPIPENMLWVIPAIFLVFAAGGYFLVTVSNFNAMLKSLQPAAALQRFVGWMFVVTGLALALASSWIIFIDGHR
jgi:hypothetical protein